MSKIKLDIILEEGEGLHSEFKVKQDKNLAKSMVAFANGQGGAIFLGVNDNGEVVGVVLNNKLKSEIEDIARNCDPGINIQLIPHEHGKGGVLEIKIPEGKNKPYKCAEGFFIRNGSSSQKLKRDEIVYLVQMNGHIQFDNAVNAQFHYPEDFSEKKLTDYLGRCGIDKNFPLEDLLVSLGVAIIENKKLVFNNTGVLFFATDPQKFFPESCITCVQYKTSDRFSIIDKKDMLGSPIDQIEAAMTFLLSHIPVKAHFKLGANSNLNPDHLGMRTDIYTYPLIALREAVVNAVTHRDYLYNASRIYIHLYPDYIEMENPGGLYHGLTIEMLGKRSVRRNPLIADLLHRAKYIERVGSGIDRIQTSLHENNNPPMEVSATNFFNMRIYSRVDTEADLQLTTRQLHIYYAIKERGLVTRKQVADFLSISDDTAVRELNVLIAKKLIYKQGEGKAVLYVIGTGGYGGGSGSGSGYPDGSGHGGSG